MKLISCIVTHNRLDYTKECVESYLATTKRDETFLVVVDNASTDGTVEYLKSVTEIDLVVPNETNMYPGYAVNQGWNAALGFVDAPLLHRSDNDVAYRKGWFDHVERMLDWKEIGQLGLLTFDENGGNGMENNVIPHPVHQDIDMNFHHSANIGGICVVRKEVWDAGVRYPTTPWQPGANEDYWFSLEVRNLGYSLVAVVDPIVENLSKNQMEKYPEYTEFTTGVRQIDWHWR